MRGWSCGARTPARAAVCGRDLPPADALAADQRITAYARDLRAAGVEGTMDQLRARAFLDFTLGVSSFPPPDGPSPVSTDSQPSPGSPRPGSPGADGQASPGGPHPASGPSPDGSRPAGAGSGHGPDGPASPGGSRPASGPSPDGCHPASGPSPDGPAPAAPATGNAGPGHPGGGDTHTGRPDTAGPGHGTADHTQPGGTSQPSPGPAGPSADAGGAPTGPPAPGNPGRTPPVPGAAGPAARINLTIPLATLLGLADRPGDAHGLGPIDPDLARTLADAAATNPRTTWCLTITDQHGHPTAHGCARPTRSQRARRITGTSGNGTRDGPAFTPEQDHAPPGPDGHGRWRLTTPGPAGRDYTIDIGPLAVTGCDHRDESAGYQPSDRLRHLVEIRDGECTWPPCRRHARSCDFEHAVPWEKGGRTCACNAGARCRHHHHAKQAPGWRLDQHQPGHHTWTTPAGRTYTTGPTQYPI